jgi:hypothetical protein
MLYNKFVRKVCKTRVLYNEFDRISLSENLLPASFQNLTGYRKLAARELQHAFCL